MFQVAIRKYLSLFHSAMNRPQARFLINRIEPAKALSGGVYCPPPLPIACTQALDRLFVVIHDI
jgi:hypothetical protein